MKPEKDNGAEKIIDMADNTTNIKNPRCPDDVKDCLKPYSPKMAIFRLGWLQCSADGLKLAVPRDPDSLKLEVTNFSVLSKVKCDFKL